VSRFLDEMASASALRVMDAKRREAPGALERRARLTLPAPPLRLSAGGFDVIAELKLRSPAAGILGAASEDWPGRVAAYARGGAAAVSVLTEPSRFDGSMQHLERAASVLKPLGVPAMRKDFLVDPYQIAEARAAGAGGVLVILRMLSRPRITELLDAAAAHGLFVLLEAFDAADLELAGLLLAERAQRGEILLVGLNCRDLQTLEVVQERFAALAARLPQGFPAVAESGVATPADAKRVAVLGFRLALIGAALMAREDPAALIEEILQTARTLKA
jgi:indole-3-glycerol phosphate synthase